VKRRESDSALLSDIATLVGDNISGQVDAEQHEHGKQRLLAALRARPSRRRLWKARPFALAGGVGVLCAGATLVLKEQTSLELDYEIGGGRLSDSGYVGSVGPSGARLAFSDGTRIDLEDGARARIVSVNMRDARLALESGHASLALAAGSAAWHFDAGPFVVQATRGTQFDLDWSSYDDTLTVELREGSLRVSGPPAPSGVRLRERQRLTAHEGRLSIEVLARASEVQGVAASTVVPPDPSLAPAPDFPSNEVGSAWPEDLFLPFDHAALPTASSAAVIPLVPTHRSSEAAKTVLVESAAAEHQAASR